MASRNSKSRMIYWKISYCKQLTRVSIFAKLLFSWLIPNTDDLGRMEGEPEILKGMIFPYEKDITAEMITQALQELSSQGLILWYQVEENCYIEFPNFSKYQKLRQDRQYTSDYPDPYDIDTTRHDKSCHVGQKLREENRREEKGSEGEENIYSSPFGEGESTLAESLPDSIESQTIENLSNRYTGKGAQYKTGIGSNDTTSAEKSLENDRAQSTGRSEYSTEFEEFWSYYPRRVGKQAAYKAWTAQLKKKYKPEKMIAASRNYSEYCRMMGYDQKYMKHAATFLGSNSPFTEFVEGLPEDIGSTAKHKGGGMNGADKQDNGQPADRFRETIGFNE